MPTSHLGQADFPVEQVTFHVHLDRGPKVISQLSHKRGKQKQACTSLGQAKFESSLSKGQAQIKFFLAVFLQLQYQSLGNHLDIPFEIHVNVTLQKHITMIKNQCGLHTFALSTIGFGCPLWP